MFDKGKSILKIAEELGLKANTLHRVEPAQQNTQDMKVPQGDSSKTLESLHRRTIEENCRLGYIGENAI